jgi:hypothetical protein
MELSIDTRAIGKHRSSREGQRWPRRRALSPPALDATPADDRRLMSRLGIDKSELSKAVRVPPGSYAASGWGGERGKRTGVAPSLPIVGVGRLELKPTSTSNAAACAFIAPVG